MKTLKFIFCLSLLLFVSCNREDVIIEGDPTPKIEFDSESGLYTTKVGREITLSPEVKYATDAYYTWLINGKIVGTEPTFTAKWDEIQEVFITFRVENKTKVAEQEIRVDVVELTPPIISLSLPSKGLKVVSNKEYNFHPDIQHKDEPDFKCEWYLNDELVGEDTVYLFKKEELGTYKILLQASNFDGKEKKEFKIEVVDKMPYQVYFPKASYFSEERKFHHVFWDGSIYLQPLTEYFENPTFTWYLKKGGLNTVFEKQQASGDIFMLSPGQPSLSDVRVEVREKEAATRSITRNITEEPTVITAETKVMCFNKREEQRFREASASSLRVWNKVYEYCPAPGQFINETKTGGFTGNEKTWEAAVEYAAYRMTKEGKQYGSQYVSLGGYGGYIIVGFDHSIKNGNDGEYDFAVQGNAFKGSSEPGIVWVMQDVNGNGLPDDEWYQLATSESGKGEIHNFSVTYFRPGKKADVQWTDINGKNGWIDYLGQYHPQDSYYPIWVKEDSYTLWGSYVKEDITQDPVSGHYSNNALAWGFVDNFGEDMIPGGSVVDGSGQLNGFKISNAIHKDGSKAELKYIDFIKVQVAVNAKAGWLGENSTEVFSFIDLRIPQPTE